MADAGTHKVRCLLGRAITERGMTLRELSDKTGISRVNLSILKNDRAKAVRFSTLTQLCTALDCSVGDLFEVTVFPNDPSRE